MSISRVSVRFAVAAALLLSLAVAATALGGGRPFSGAMTGAQEAPGPGDPDGSGTYSLTLNQGLGEVCFELAVADIALPATGAHIHRAPAGVEGGVVVPLIAPGADGTSAGCAAASPELIMEIRQDPSAFYINVHSTEFQAGAVRDQLSK